MRERLISLLKTPRLSKRGTATVAVPEVERSARRTTPPYFRPKTLRTWTGSKAERQANVSVRTFQMTDTMMKAVLEVLAFLALTGDDVIDQDTAVAELEYLAHIL